MATRDQFKGCLLGQALGDALGFPVEGHGPEDCQDYVGSFLSPADPAKLLGRPPFPFGQYTDDTQLFREMLQSAVACGGFNPAHYAAAVGAIFAEHRIVGRGRATEMAAEKLARGVPWEEAGTPAPSAGNGSAMRAGAVGLLAGDDPQRLCALAAQQSVITHKDKRCQGGAIAIAGAVSLALQTDEISADTFLSQLEAWCRPVSAVMADVLQDLHGWLGLPPEAAAKTLAEAGIAPGYQKFWHGISPYVVSSVAYSLYAFLRSPGDYWTAVCTAIKGGGDVDTTAAMTGSIAGAHLGVSALPQPLLDKLTDRGSWGRAELERLAGQTFDLVHREG